jgi:hypothetical protein
MAASIRIFVFFAGLSRAEASVLRMLHGRSHGMIYPTGALLF